MGIKCAVCGVTGVDELFYGPEGDLYCSQHRPDERGELRAEVARLREALVALVATEPTYDDEGAGTRCGYCGGRRRYLSVISTTIDHKDDCPWRAAKALLDE